MSAQNNRFPTWMVVVAVIILLPLVVWVLAITLNLLAALSIGGILLIVGIVWLFTKLRSDIES